MKLTVLDRLLIQEIVPKKGNHLALIAISSLITKVSFDLDEATSLGLTRKENTLTWREDAPDKDIEITGIESATVVASLQELDAKKELTIGHLSLWSKFIETTN